MVRSDLAKSVQGRSQDSNHLPDTLAMHVAGDITVAVCMLMNNSAMRQHGCYCLGRLTFPSGSDEKRQHHISSD